MGIDLGQDGALGDVGDVPLGTSGAEVRARIEDAVRTLLDAGGRPIALGGDHSITYPIVRAVRWFHPRLSILHFDAHPDLHPEFQGDPYSHACPFARIMDEKLADQLVQVGIRTMNATQRTQAERHGRSEEHTSELQSRLHLVCRLLLEKKKPTKKEPHQFNTS